MQNTLLATAAMLAFGTTCGFLNQAAREVNKSERGMRGFMGALPSLSAAGSCFVLGLAISGAGFVSLIAGPM